MEFDLEKARELFETGQFASITRALGPASNYIRQIHPHGRSLLAHALVYTGRLYSRVPTRQLYWQCRLSTFGAG